MNMLKGLKEDIKNASRKKVITQTVELNSENISSHDSRAEQRNRVIKEDTTQRKTTKEKLRRSN